MKLANFFECIISGSGAEKTREVPRGSVCSKILPLLIKAPVHEDLYSHLEKSARFSLTPLCFNPVPLRDVSNFDNSF